MNIFKDLMLDQYIEVVGRDRVSGIKHEKILIIKLYNWKFQRGNSTIDEVLIMFELALSGAVIKHPCKFLNLNLDRSLTIMYL